jgi:6-phosphogluconolactonase (cycloisomerase 2 family)
MRGRVARIRIRKIRLKADDMLWAGIPVSLKTSMKALRFKSQRTLLSVAVAVAVACCACMVSFLPRAYAQEAAIFFTDRGTGKVHSSDPAGGDNKVLAKIQSSNLRGIVADVPDGKVYFADNGTGKIYQVNLDGTGLKAIVSGLGFPADLTMDRKQRKLYWCDQQKNHLRRCNLDGTAAETVVETEQPYYLDIDPEGGFLYWGTFFKRGSIYRRKIDGGKVDTLLSAPTAGLIQVRAVRFNPIDNLLYWVDREAHKIQRAPIKDDRIAAADIEDLYTGLDTPHGMTLDPAAGVLYWCDTGTNRVEGSRGSHNVMRGSLDGKAEPATIFTGSQPWDIDVYRPAAEDSDEASN